MAGRRPVVRKYRKSPVQLSFEDDFGGSLEKMLHELDDADILCRDLGHPWQPFSAKPIPGGGFEQILRCPRCKTKKARFLDRSGCQVKRPPYEYRDGYLVKGVGRLSSADRDTVRLFSVTRLIK